MSASDPGSSSSGGPTGETTDAPTTDAPTGTAPGETGVSTDTSGGDEREIVNVGVLADIFEG